MPDIVSPDKRSKMMSGIRGKDTKPEMIIRRALFKRGFRYRLHVKNLPGKPDIVFPKYKSVILVNGCFWHGHNCHLFKLPRSRPEFWNRKIKDTQRRDKTQVKKLETLGWRICIIWECCLKGRESLPINEVVDNIDHWLKGVASSLEIRGYK
ncbi:very short patch repair endonuclease [Kiloniella sp.]|uniref:very short patch repair endonuclease n=1 Tax=Kiloniella sp. TaxID=1938587 RepID=UPI003B01B001